MASLVLTGDTSGTITVSAPAVAGSNTLTLQAGTATNSMNTLATAVASTSGTSIDFTGLPAWVKKITVMFAGVSTNGTSIVQILLGTGGTPTYATSGYSAIGTSSTGTLSIAGSTTGFLTGGDSAATYVRDGAIVFTTLGSNVWTCTGALFDRALSRAFTNGGTITLGATLTAVRITTVNGTDTFDAGSINILYEG